MTTQEFIAALNTENQELVEKMQACKAPEEAFAAAKDAGLSDDYDTFVAEMTKFYESVKDLTDDDLENVAAGVLSKGQISLAVTTGGVGGLAAFGAFLA